MLEGFPFTISGFYADKGYLNFQRPCLFAEDTIDPRASKEKRYNAKLCVGGMSESAYPCA